MSTSLTNGVGVIGATMSSRQGHAHHDITLNVIQADGAGMLVACRRQTVNTGKATQTAPSARPRGGRHLRQPERYPDGCAEHAVAGLSKYLATSG